MNEDSILKPEEIQNEEFYWWRQSKSHRWEVVWIDVDADRRLMLHPSIALHSKALYLCGEFMGPLKPSVPKTSSEIVSNEIIKRLETIQEGVDHLKFMLI